MNRLDLIDVSNKNYPVKRAEWNNPPLPMIDISCLTWLISALGFPDYEAVVHAYGTVIGTGNAIVGWDPRQAKV